MRLLSRAARGQPGRSAGSSAQASVGILLDELADGAADLARIAAVPVRPGRRGTASIASRSAAS